MGLLLDMRSAAFVALAILASAANGAQVSGQASGAPAPGTRWGEPAAFRLKGTVRMRSARESARRRSAVAATGQPVSNWSPRIGVGSGQSARNAARPPFSLETLPVRIGGQRFVLSRFTMNRAGVRGMISTAF